MSGTKDKTYLGTELKYKVTITASGFSMDDDDWSVTISRGKISKSFPKSECIHGEDGWYVCFDTSELGAGQYIATITALVPDDDFPDGFRTEVQKITLPLVEQ